MWRRQRRSERQNPVNTSERGEGRGGPKLWVWVWLHVSARCCIISSSVTLGDFHLRIVLLVGLLAVTLVERNPNQFSDSACKLYFVCFFLLGGSFSSPLGLHWTICFSPDSLDRSRLLLLLLAVRKKKKVICICSSLLTGEEGLCGLLCSGFRGGGLGP